MSIIEPFPAQHMEVVARVLGDTADGLKGDEIGAILRDAKVPGIDAALLLPAGGALAQKLMDRAPGQGAGGLADSLRKVPIFGIV